MIHWSNPRYVPASLAAREHTGCLSGYVIIPPRVFSYGCKDGSSSGMGNRVVVKPAAAPDRRVAEFLAWLSSPKTLGILFVGQPIVYDDHRIEWRLDLDADERSRYRTVTYDLRLRTWTISGVAPVIGRDRFGSVLDDLADHRLLKRIQSTHGGLVSYAWLEQQFEARRTFEQAIHDANTRHAVLLVKPPGGAKAVSSSYF